jgi:D-arabinose 1-dehydrogenase-like Zn-dependent alcohol dehydrogenase
MSQIHALAATEANGLFQPFSCDPGPLGDEQVEIAIAYCGVCHSDLSMRNNEWQFTQYPFVPGHEAIGKVVAVEPHAKAVSGSPSGSPAAVARMLEFAARHGIAPVVEAFPMSQANQALEHLEAGKARYRIVLKNDLG